MWCQNGQIKIVNSTCVKIINDYNFCNNSYLRIIEIAKYESDV
jgi:hypothetical protein